MDMAYEELMMREKETTKMREKETTKMREKETTKMCETCQRGITFIPNDLVVRTFRIPDWDFEKQALFHYDAMQVGKVLEVSPEVGTVLVLWGTNKDKEIEREWCWPSDFVARIRNGKYETFHELWTDPS